MTKYLAMISEYYGDRKAERSQVPLINHIKEGIILLNHLREDESTIGAFCVHPIFQGDEALKKNYERYGPLVEPYVMLLIMEYRKSANSYTTKNGRYYFDIQLSPLREVNSMLIVDKVQNKKDFIKHLRGKIDCSSFLDMYFEDWLRALEVQDQYEELAKLIS